MYKETCGPEAMKYLATKPTIIITTLHASGIVNAGVFGSYTNLSETRVGFVIGRQSHTHRNILRSGEFVANVPGVDLVKTLAVIANDISETLSEVDEAGLTLRNGVMVKTPSIAECQAAVELLFEKELPVGEHGLIVGKVVGGWIRETALDSDGAIDIFRARVLKDFKYPEPLYVLPGKVVKG